MHKFVVLNKGDIYEIDETGGGGYGNPFERDVNTVIDDDVLDGLVSIERAKSEYGVVVNPETMTLDLEATRVLRDTAR